MIPVEKNDVDIRKLFEWSKKVTIRIKGKDVDFYLRLVGDADAARARVAALRASAELRKKLLDENSDEHLAYIPIFSEDDKPKLVEYLLILEAKEFSKQALMEVNVPLPREPKSDAPLEVWEKYQKEVDEYPRKRQEAINAYISTLVERRRADLSQKSFEELRDLFQRYIVDEICEQKMLDVYHEYCVFLGLYKDENFTERVFETFEDFANLPSKVKEELILQYTMLQIDMEDLKK